MRNTTRGLAMINPDSGDVLKEFDPADVVVLRNPETGDLTGETITMGEVYAILASAYWQFAPAKDEETHS